MRIINMNWKEITEEHFDYMLGCVPPLHFTGAAFLCGEPLCFNDNGKNVYSAFIEVNGQYFESECTEVEFRPFTWTIEINNTLLNKQD